MDFQLGQVRMRGGTEMSAWTIIPPAILYVSLFIAVRKFSVLGSHPRAVFGSWLGLTLSWFLVAHYSGF